MKKSRSYYLVVNGKKLDYEYKNPLHVNKIMLKMIRNGFNPEDIKIRVSGRRQHV